MVNIIGRDKELKNIFNELFTLSRIDSEDNAERIFSDVRDGVPFIAEEGLGKNSIIERNEILVFPSGNHIALIGDRGIGKSLILKWIHENCNKLGVMPIYASLDPSIDANQLAKRLTLSLAENLSQGNYSTLRGLLDFMSNFKVAGNSYSGPTKSRNYSIEEFCFTLVRAIEGDVGEGENNENEKSQNGSRLNLFRRISEIQTAKKSTEIISKNIKEIISRNFLSGVLIIIDEIDSASSEKLPIGAVLKTILEYLTFHKVPNVSIVIAGLPYMRDLIYQSHPSTWREFTNFDINPINEEETNNSLHKLAEFFLKEYNDEMNFRGDTLAKIALVSDGYPHWIKELVIQSAKLKGEINETDSLKKIITNNDLSMSKYSAYKNVWENYYVSDYESLCNTSKYLLRLVAIHCRNKVRVDWLENISKLEKKTFDRLLDSLYKKQLIEIDVESGIHHYVSIRSLSYRNWISQIMHPLVDPIAEFRILGTIEDLPVPTTIAGENTTAFKSFEALLRKYSPTEQSSELEVKKYDADKDLFNSFSLKAPVVNFRTDERININSVTHRASTSFRSLWEKSDIISIPHYFVGQASNLGLWTFEELIPEQVGIVKEYFEYVLHDFTETCTYKGHLVGVPFAFMSKVLASKINIPTPKYWNSLLERSNQEECKLHLDSAPNSISLWYEWHQLVDNSKWRILKRNSSDEIPQLNPELYELNENDEKVFKKGSDVDELFNVVLKFAELISKIAIGGFGDSKGWENSSLFASKELADRDLDVVSASDFKSMWVDFAVDIQNRSRESDQSTVYWYDIPKFEYEGSKSEDYIQPIESWVFVIPRRDNSKHHRENAKKWASFLVSTLTMAWQLEFQKAGGCSPIRWLAQSSGVKNSQPWTEFVASNIKIKDDKLIDGQTSQHLFSKSDFLRGKSPKEIDIMQLEIAFLTYLFFKREEGNKFTPHSVEELKKEELRKRFDNAFEPFLVNMHHICNED